MCRRCFIIWGKDRESGDWESGEWKVESGNARCHLLAPPHAGSVSKGDEARTPVSP